jgi:two-component system, OmpR family, phosphate regulon sensor histidine kinase PhoR
MKLNRNILFIGISSLALILVLVIQVTWMFKTAKVKEELFNEKANMILSKTADALGSDKETCLKMERCCVIENLGDCKLDLEQNEVEKIDAILQKFMNSYNFHLEYTFSVIQPKTQESNWQKNKTNSNVFTTSIDEIASKSGIKLKLIFPDKKQYILAEMGPLFATSVLLVLVVLILFWRTSWSLVREKKISEHLTDFLNNMAHEFKTPLTNIGLAGKMIAKESGIKNEDKITHYTEIILQENEKLRLQVEQVLGMAALERGEIPLVKTTLDFHQVLLDATRCISVQLENANGELHMDLTATKFTVLGDKTHLSNAICNLIDNAIKYAKENPFLSIKTSNIENVLIIEIADKGIGIDKSFQKRIFEKFYRVPTGDLHNVKGFGLGLAYVKKIIELHGGTIDVSSEIGYGALFIIRLPLKND